jgi:hypothetical protein
MSKRSQTALQCGMFNDSLQCVVVECTMITPLLTKPRVNSEDRRPHQPTFHPNRNSAHREARPAPLRWVVETKVVRHGVR